MRTTVANGILEKGEDWAAQVTALFENNPDAMFCVDADYRLVAYNPAAAGYIRNAWGTPIACGKTAYDLFPRDRAEFWTGLFARVLAEGAVRTEVELPGDIRLEFTLNAVLENGDVTGIAAIGRDITERKRRRAGSRKGQPGVAGQSGSVEPAERERLEAQAAAHLRELRMLSEINSALLRARAEHELLEDYCRITVEVGGYLMSWVGFAEDSPGKPMFPVAHFGSELESLEASRIAWWEQFEWGDSPAGRAIRSGEIQYSENIETDPAMAPWRDECMARGYRAMISLPFRPSPTEWACLNAYSATPVPWSEGERKLLEQVASALGYGIRTLRDSVTKEKYQEDLRSSLEQIIEVLAGTVHHRDPYTAHHQRRVADLSVHVARRLGLPAERIHGLRLAAIIHDLGKVAVPSEILTYPGGLTPLQMNLVKEHAQLGYEIVKNVPFPWPIAETIRQHHERFDGTGYPLGLMGDAILLEARIITVADVVESMGTHRPYRASRGIETALQEIVDGSGTRYDPHVVDACLAVFREEGYQLPT